MLHSKNRHYFQSMKRQSIICSFIYFILLTVLSFTWQYLPSGNRNMKGDDFFFCLELVVVLNVIYLVIIKGISKTRFPFWSLFLLLLLIFITSTLLSGILSILFSLNDFQSLRLYFYIHGLVAIAYVLLTLKYFSRTSLKL